MQILSDSRLKTGLVRLGFDRLIRPLLGGTGVILALHRVRDPANDLVFAANRDNMIGRDRLGCLLEDLRRQQVPIVSLDEALERRRAGWRERFVCLTFDDGYVDNHDVLFPLAQGLGVPVTIYVTPGLLDGTAPLWWYGLDVVIARHARVHLPLGRAETLPTATRKEKDNAFARCLAFMLAADGPRRAALIDVLADRYGVSWPSIAVQHMMSWAQLDAMARSPLITIGAHTLTHPVLTRLDLVEASSEIAGSRSVVSQKLGRPVRHFAYPFGTMQACGRREAGLVAAAGFRSAVTTLPGNLSDLRRHDPFLLPRHGLGPRDGYASMALKRAGFRRGLGGKPWSIRSAHRDIEEV